MKSHSKLIARKELHQQRVALLKMFEVLKALGEKPSKNQRLLAHLIDAQIWWLTKSKLATTKTMQYDRRIKRLTKKLGKG